MRLGQRRRPIRRIEQTSSLENVWLVLFFDKRRLLHFFDSLSLASRQSEIWSWLGVWNSRYCNVDRDFVLLGRSQQDGPRAAGGDYFFFWPRNVQQGRSSYARPDRDGLLFHFVFLGAVGNEQRRRMDVAGRENEPALDGHGSDRGPGPNGEPDSHFDFYSAGELRDLSGDQQGFSAHSAAKNRHRPFYYRALLCRDCYDPGMDRLRTETEH